MTTIVILTVLTLSTALADYCVKSASSHPAGVLSATFALGALLYALQAFGWLVLMRSHTLAALAAFYACAMLLKGVGVGALVFKEPLSLREAAGLTLAAAAVLVMHEPRP